MTNRVSARRIGEPVTVGLAGAITLVVIDPVEDGRSWCPSAVLFGVACPLCGLTRATSRLVRGDVGESLSFHPMAWLVLTVAAAAWILWFGRRAGWWSFRPVRLERWTLGLLVVGLVTVWAVRAVAGTLPPI